MEKIIQKITIIICCGMLLSLGVWFFLCPKREYSPNENRYLATLPELTVSGLLEGEYTEKLTDYVTDQFPARDMFLGIGSEALRLSGRKEINGLYLSADDYLIEEYKEPIGTERVIRMFNQLQSDLTSAECILMLVPTASVIYSDKLPSFAPQAEQLALRDTIYEGCDMQKVDAAGALEKAAREGIEYLYYRTDHHWTTTGAYVAYRAFCETMGMEAVAETNDLTAVSEDFRGTLFSKLNDPLLPYDTISLYENPAWELTVEYTDTGEVTDTLYNLEYLTQKDQYSVFLNNIHSQIVITNDAVADGGIAVIKDSFANSLVPYLVDHYHEVVVFDTRYYRGGPSVYINEHPEITQVLILFNLNTVDQDLAIGGIY